LGSATALKDRAVAVGLPLFTLLSNVLVAFTIEFDNEFERESDLSLAISANVVRVLNEKGVRVRDVPLLAGVSKEAASMALGFLQKKGIAIVDVETDPAGSRAKIARLTSKGRAAQVAYRQIVGSIEERWKTRFGEKTIRTLRELLERLVVEPIAVEPYPDGWRARVPKPQNVAALPDGAASWRIPGWQSTGSIQPDQGTLVERATFADDHAKREN
jgi:DNA-binding MarR family transcriptional regulator